MTNNISKWENYRRHKKIGRFTMATNALALSAALVATGASAQTVANFTGNTEASVTHPLY